MEKAEIVRGYSEVVRRSFNTSFTVSRCTFDLRAWILG